MAIKNKTMSTKVFQVLSNLKLGEELHEKGKLLVLEAEAFAHLVKDGVLKAVEGAKNVADAQKILDKESATEAAKPSQEAAKPANTWEAKPNTKPEEKKEDTVGQTSTDGKVSEAPKETSTSQVGQGDVAPKLEDGAGDNL